MSIPTDRSIRTPKMRSEKNSNHVPALDGVRGIAIIAVMIHHFAYGAVGQSPISKIAVSVFEGGWMGVDLFFVLSGYLITGILLDAKSSSHYFRNFYARRTLRIFPLYYGYLFVVCVVIARYTSFDVSRSVELVSYQHWLWFYGTNILICMRGAFLVASVNHFWTLAIEEHFYLLWPTVVRWVSFRRMWLGSLVCITFAVISRCVFYFSQVWKMAPMTFTFCRVDSLAMGGLLAVLLRYSLIAPRVKYVSRYTLVLTAPVVVWYLQGGERSAIGQAVLQTVGYTLISVFFTSLLAQIVLSRGAFHQWFCGKTLRFFGIYAYGLYVFHHPIRIVIQRVISFERLGVMIGSYWFGLLIHSIVAGVASIGISLASYHLFEKQILKLKRYFEYR